MSNLSYCRMENTFGDLQDCWEFIRNQNAWEFEEMSQSEFNYMVRLVDLCHEIASEIEPFITVTED